MATVSALAETMADALVSGLLYFYFFAEVTMVASSVATVVVQVATASGLSF